jgi:hypothetical protein
MRKIGSVESYINWSDMMQGRDDGHSEHGETGDSHFMVTGAFGACCRIYLVANWISTLDKASRLAI